MTDYCAACHAILVGKSRFCTTCGAPTRIAPAIFCPHCKQQLAPNNKFCHACGAQVAVADHVLPEQVAVMARQSGTRIVPPPEAPDGKLPASSSPTPSILPEINIAPTAMAAIPAQPKAAIAPEQAPLLPDEMAVGKSRPWLAIVSVTLILLAAGGGVASYLFAQKEPAAPTDAATVDSAEHPSPGEPGATGDSDTATTADDTHPPAQAVSPLPPRTAEASRPVRRGCEDLSGFTKFICNTEGAERFWKCSPDGINWDSNIPGCARNSNANKRLY
jgi:hypothetical protein